MTEEEAYQLDIEVLLATGWRRAGEDDMVKPMHRKSLDYPGTTVDDWNTHGPHPRLQGPNGERVYFCSCRSTVAMPSPNSDPAEAMRLLSEHILRLERSGGEPTRWAAGTHFKALGYGDTPAEAICRAVVALAKERH